MENLEIALLKYNKKTWFKSALLGLIIGIAVIVPGISGSTVAIIFKLYDQFLYAIGNLFKQFKKCFAFLLPIGLGVVAGFLLGFITVQQLLKINLFAIVCLFAGLMCGAFPAVSDEVKGAKKTPLRIGLFLLGVAIPVAMGCLSALSTTGEAVGAVDKFASIEWWHVALAFAFGAVVGITQIVPGLSASAFLMAVGWYNSLMSSVSMTYWKGNPAVFLIYAGLGLGFLFGIFAFSKLLTYVFSKSRHTAYSMIVGLSLGSILSMFCNGDIVSVYVGWASGEPWILSVVLGVILFTIGVFAAYKLVQYERKKNAGNVDNAEKTQDTENA